MLETADGAKAAAEPAKMTDRADVNFILICYRIRRLVYTAVKLVLAFVLSWKCVDKKCEGGLQK